MYLPRSLSLSEYLGHTYVSSFCLSLLQGTEGSSFVTAECVNASDKMHLSLFTLEDTEKLLII